MFDWLHFTVENVILYEKSSFVLISRLRHKSYILRKLRVLDEKEGM